jgi:predicted nuclease of predicted toxin-antitoxin system
LAEINFLADESCDFTVVRALRAAKFDVLSVAESFPSISDEQVLQRSLKEERILLTEDKDFGEWVFAHGKKVPGVILVRFPGNARKQLAEEIRMLVEDYGTDLIRNFVVLEPGRARIRKI